MAEGTQPQQPSQLGPGAAARGMKRESELELPVPGGGGDGAEPGLSKRPRTEEAAADGGGGGMQVTARDGRPVTAGVRRGSRGAARGSRGLERGGPRGLGLEVGGGRSWPVWKVGRAPAWRRSVPGDPGVPTRVLIIEGTRGHDAWMGFGGKSNMVEMDSISSNPSLVPWGGVKAGRSWVCSPESRWTESRTRGQWWDTSREGVPFGSRGHTLGWGRGVAHNKREESKARKLLESPEGMWLRLWVKSVPPGM